MALIDDLREMEQNIPPSHCPTVGETAQLLGAIIAYQEHGDKLLEAANSDDPQDLADLLGGSADSSSTTPPTTTPKPAPTTSKA